MSDTSESDERKPITMLTQPSNALAYWYVGLGLWGLFLAVLNILGYIHPNYRVSWGGLLTFELTNDAFGTKTDASAFVAGDAIFMLLCGGALYLGINSLAGDDGIDNWLKSLLKCECHKDLIGGDDSNWNTIVGTWLVLISLVFYFYWGIMYMAWIDLGVYAVSVVLFASGIILRMLADVEEDSD